MSETRQGDEYDPGLLSFDEAMALYDAEDKPEKAGMLQQNDSYPHLTPEDLYAAVRYLEHQRERELSPEEMDRAQRTPIPSDYGETWKKVPNRAARRRSSRKARKKSR